MTKRFTVHDARAALRRLFRILPPKATLRDLARGMTVELEHRDVTRGDPLLSARIALAHLKERPDYYDLIAKLEHAPRTRNNPSGRAYLFVSDVGDMRVYLVRRAPYVNGGLNDGGDELAAATIKQKGDVLVGDIMLRQYPLQSAITLYFYVDEFGDFEWRRAVYYATSKSRGVEFDLQSVLDARGPEIDAMLTLINQQPAPLIGADGRSDGSYVLHDWPYMEEAGDAAAK